jgi:resuscitation-promoting factor RpfB
VRRPTRPIALVLQIVVVAVLVATTAAFVALSKTVTLSVDGKARSVSSLSRTVGDVLKREDITLGPHDTVAPPVDTKVTDGQRIAVRYGRLLTLTLDGHQRQVWVTAQSVREALDQLGLRADSAKLSVSRSMPIGRDGLRLDVRLPHHLVVKADGKRHAVTTTALTVRQALAQAHVRFDGNDRVSAPLGAYPADGQVITIKRVRVKTVKHRVTLDYDTVYKKTQKLYDGDSNVRRAGESGTKVLVYRVTKVDGKRVSRKLVRSDVLAKPVDAIVAVGTKSRPVTPSAPSPSSSSSSPSSPSHESSSPAPSPSSDGLNWAAVANCESGGNPNAVDSTGSYYGLYQFTIATWHAVGGSGIPTDASPAEQTARAQILYNRSGAGQWPICGKYL